MELDGNCLTGIAGGDLGADVLQALAAIDDAARAQRTVAPACVAGGTDPVVGRRVGAITEMTTGYALYTLGGLRIAAGTSVRATGARLGLA